MRKKHYANNISQHNQSVMNLLDEDPPDPRNALTQLNILRACTEAFDSLSAAPSEDLEDYTRRLEEQLVEIHRNVIRCSPVKIDLTHLEYRSLIINTRRGIVDQKTEVRRIFTSGEPPPNEPSLLERFADEVKTYEPGRDILPQVECDFCSVLFSAKSFPDPSHWLQKGVYPIGPSGLTVLSEVLKKVRLCPWKMGEVELKKACKAFAESQGDLPHEWNKIIEQVPKGLLPNFEGVFELALKSAITTMQIVSNSLFDAHVEYLPKPEGTKWECGMRWGRMSKDELIKLRDRMLIEEFHSSRDALPQRALTFIPIRMRRSSGDDKVRETIGLVAYYSEEPIYAKTAASLAVIEHLIFLTCRQYELFQLQNSLQKQLGALELQRIFARLMAHEVIKPLGAVRDSLHLIEEAMRDSGGALGKFTRGDSSKLQKPRKVDLYEIMMEIKKWQAARLDKDRIRYEDEVRRGTYVQADWEAVRYTLGVLVDNAIAHGGGKVRVWTEKKMDERKSQTFLVTYVANNGERMLPQLEEAIQAGQPPVKAQDDFKSSKLPPIV